MTCRPRRPTSLVCSLAPSFCRSGVLQTNLEQSISIRRVYGYNSVNCGRYCLDPITVLTPLTGKPNAKTQTKITYRLLHIGYRATHR